MPREKAIAYDEVEGLPREREIFAEALSADLTNRRREEWSCWDSTDRI
jgi:hypothetical protein